jgi:hypothetical protein
MLFIGDIWRLPVGKRAYSPINGKYRRETRTSGDNCGLSAIHPAYRRYMAFIGDKWRFPEVKRGLAGDGRPFPAITCDFRPGSSLVKLRQSRGTKQNGRKMGAEK